MQVASVLSRGCRLRTDPPVRFAIDEDYERDWKRLPSQLDELDQRRKYTEAKDHDTVHTIRNFSVLSGPRQSRPRTSLGQIRAPRAITLGHLYEPGWVFLYREFGSNFILVVAGC